ncbi:MAG: hypothetical protein EXS37_08750 [Opitutus sp.]|nr:hypothetical protein [Opitutus sp.]
MTAPVPPTPPAPAKKPKDRPPSPEELEKALEDLFYAAHQCATWHFWYFLVGAVLKDAKEASIHTPTTLIQNGVAEATLLFVRNTAVFFKPQEPNDKTDTVYSYRYAGYTRQEWIIPFDPTYIELHKRVGHITIRQTRYGRMEWPVFPMVMQAMNKWAEFFEALISIPSSHNAKRADQCTQYARAIRTLIQRMENDVKKDEALNKKETF